MARVFISHSSEDKVYAHAIAEKLEEWGYEPFVDFDATRGVIGGSDWESEVLRAIRDSVAVLVCFTEAVASSLWCFAETLIARYEKKPVIPVLLHGPSDSIWGIVRQTVQYIDLGSDPEQGYARLRVALDQLVPVNEHRATDTRTVGAPPYAGLAPFTERDSPYYFGRDRDVRAALSRLQPRPMRETPRVLTITGASGSGKSSLVSAALLPSLRRGVVSGSNEWVYLTTQPSSHPSRRLAEAIRSVVPSLGSTRDLMHRIDADPDGLSYLLSDVLADVSASTACLVIDQLEELVTVGDDRSDAFAKGLAVAVEELGHDRLVIISTVRVDMLESLLTRVELSKHLLADPLILTSLERSDLERVVIGPANAVGWDVDDELVQQLVGDASSVSDPLPLLSFVLRLMYDSAKPPGRLRIEEYLTTGGVAGALAANAEALLGGLSDDERTDMAAVMVRTLVAFADDGSVARRRASRSEVPQDVLTSFETLVAGRLLVADVDPSGAPTFEIAHEALFRHWPRLRDAIDLSETDVRYARRILQGARENWERRRGLPNRDDVVLILGSIGRLRATPDEIEVLIRAGLADRAADEWAAAQLANDPEVGREIVERILTDDDGSAQYGLLGLASDGIAPGIIDRDRLASRLAGSPVEAVRRAARRASDGSSFGSDSVVVEPGEYRVGSSSSPHLAGTSGFGISKYLVTNLEFANFVDATGAPWPAHWPAASSRAVDSVRKIADFPVVYVNYFDAVAYCLYQSSEGQVVRLPTETEWEIAFLYGAPTDRLYDFPWGSRFEPVLCNTAEAAIGRVTLIGRYSQHGGDSHSGISDLSGNVWEWTSSRGRAPDGTEVSFAQGDDPWPDQATKWAPRVQRGGTFLADANFARRAFRLVNLPDLALQDFGFRIVTETAP